jgi:hypothetical protein
MTPSGCASALPGVGALAEGSGGGRRGSTRRPPAAAGRDKWPRELLPCPLPFPALSAAVAPGLSSPTRRRVRCKQHWQQWANERASALNELYGHDAAPPSCDLSLSEGNRTCIDLIAAACRDLGKPSADLSPAGALEALCGSRAGYSDVTEASSTRAPFAEGQTSLPSAGSVPTDPSSLLQAKDLYFGGSGKPGFCYPMLSQAVVKELLLFENLSVILG